MTPQDKEIAFLRKVIKAQERLLVCYRVGGQPPEWVFDIMKKFHELYRAPATREKGEP